MDLAIFAKLKTKISFVLKGFAIKMTLGLRVSLITALVGKNYNCSITWITISLGILWNGRLLWTALARSFSALNLEDMCIVIGQA